MSPAGRVNRRGRVVDPMKNVMEPWRETFTARRVFGDSIEKDGLTVIPVAMVAGGGGAGSAPAGRGDAAEGGAGGFGGIARPVGVFVVRGDDVAWRPALDTTLLKIGGMLLTALAVLAVTRAFRWKR